MNAMEIKDAVEQIGGVKRRNEKQGMVDLDGHAAGRIFKHYATNMPDASRSTILEYVLHDLQGRNHHDWVKPRSSRIELA